MLFSTSIPLRQNKASYGGELLLPSFSFALLLPLDFLVLTLPQIQFVGVLADWAGCQR